MHFTFSRDAIQSWSVFVTFDVSSTSTQHLCFLREYAHCAVIHRDNVHRYNVHQVNLFKRTYDFIEPLSDNDVAPSPSSITNFRTKIRSITSDSIQSVFEASEFSLGKRDLWWQIMTKWNSWCEARLLSKITKRTMSVDGHRRSVNCLCCWAVMRESCWDRTSRM